MDDATILKRVGENMQRVRERAGLTQEDVARRVAEGIDQPRVSKWESGAAPASLTQLFRYADACSAAPEEIVGEIQRPKVHQPQLFRDLDPPASKLVTNLVVLLHERTQLLRARRRGAGRRAQRG